MHISFNRANDCARDDHDNLKKEIWMAIPYPLNAFGKLSNSRH